MTAIDEPGCGGCRYFDGAVMPGVVGECRRYAPRVQYERSWVDHDGDVNRPWLTSASAIWPRVVPDDWCGEFVKRD